MDIDPAEEVTVSDVSLTIKDEIDEDDDESRGNDDEDEEDEVQKWIWKTVPEAWLKSASLKSTQNSVWKLSKKSNFPLLFWERSNSV